MSQSTELFERACRVIPGGVNSPVRAFRGVGGNPIFITQGEGPYIVDADGRRYIDFVGSWGPLILGHGSAVVRDAVLRALEKGTSFGAPTEREVEFAELLTSILPGVDLIRMVNSGTEATMSAIRLARAYTQRDFILKFNGCYHGHGDSFLVNAGSGLATLGISGSPGVPVDLAQFTLSVEYNDLDAVRRVVNHVGVDRVAAIIVEPVVGNMGLVLPDPEFLTGLREICSSKGIVLIFDEVMTGFRVALGGAAERFGVKPDLATYGKVIGGGLPVGAFGGRRDIMELLAPLGSVYQAGTLSGNPLAMAAGMAAVEFLRGNDPYAVLEERTQYFMSGLRAAAQDAGISIQANCCGSMFGFFFTDAPVRNYADAKTSDVARYQRLFHSLLSKGVYLAPSAFEAGFLSLAHTKEIIDETLSAFRQALT